MRRNRLTSGKKITGRMIIWMIMMSFISLLPLGVSARELDTPMGVAASNDIGGVRVSWEAVKGASVYRVLRRNSEGGYDRITTTHKCEFFDRDASRNGTLYEYKIRAVDGDSQSERSDKASVFYLKRAKLAFLMEDITNGLRAECEKNKHASYFEFECGEDPSFTDAKTFTADKKERSVCVEDLEKGKTYYVRCRAVRDDGKTLTYSAWSSRRPLTITGRVVDPDMEIPYGVRIYSTTDAGIALYWKKPPAISGYQVWRSYHPHYGFEPVGIVTDRGIGGWTDTDFDAEHKKIYYYVCSYLEAEDGTVTYSPFSDRMNAHFRRLLKLSRDNIFMFSGEERLIEAYYGWTNAHNTVWTSSDPKVASVDQNGLITTISQGKAVITCECKDAGQSRDVSVTVDREDDPMLEEISLRYVKGDDGVWYNPGAEKKDEAVIMMAGDLMALSPQQKACRREDGTSDYRCNYDYVGPVLRQSDLAIGNLETMIASEFSYSCEEPFYMTKPISNVSSRYLEAVCYGGFDVLGTANNHNCDTGTKGIVSTIETLDRFGVPHTGYFASEEDERYLLIDVNGIKVGLLAYEDETPGYNGWSKQWDQKDVDVMLNFYEKKKAKREIRKLRKLGAEYVIVYIHWGTKNWYSPMKSQRRIALELARAGADYIAGSHSHTVQPFHYFHMKDGRVVPCIYSLGDFNSHINQIPGNRDSVLMCIRLRRGADGKVELVHSGYIPFYIYTSYEKQPYVTMPMDADWNGGLDELYKQSQITSRIADEIGEEIELFKPWMLTDNTPDPSLYENMTETESIDME